MLFKLAEYHPSVFCSMRELSDKCPITGAGWRWQAAFSKGGVMAVALEKRLTVLISDIQTIQKEVVLAKIQQQKITRRRRSVWDDLGTRVTASWDKISAVDEITSQREKSW